MSEDKYKHLLSEIEKIKKEYEEEEKAYSDWIKIGTALLSVVLICSLIVIIFGVILT